ncbi:uncharacterized protein LOC135682198 [Rhopilema esculentum]|uniref:uncharacterized protein LOC135682198 n=1 Tax=Rhopilema esculentum TaxID=499914 RepID=UPI0031CE0AA0
MGRARPKPTKLRRKCDNCDLRFRSHFCMFLHLKVHQRETQGWFHCVTCKKRFEKLTRFVKHRRRHPSRKKIKTLACKQMKEPVSEAKKFKEGKTFGSIVDGKLKSENASAKEQENINEAMLQKQKKEEPVEKKQSNGIKNTSHAFEFIKQLKSLLKLNLDSEKSDFGPNEYSLQVSEITSSDNQIGEQEEQHALNTSLEDTADNNDGKKSVNLEGHHRNHKNTASGLMEEKGKNHVKKNNGEYEVTKKETNSQAKEMPKRLYTCSLCKANFFSYSSLRKHKRVSHKVGCKSKTPHDSKGDKGSSQCVVKKYQCVLCLQELNSFKSLNCHMQDVHKCKRNIPKNFRQRLAINGMNLFCQDSVDVAVNCLGSSYFENTNESSLLKCSLCGANFLTYGGLKGHLKSKHKIGVISTVKPKSPPKKKEATGKVSGSSSKRGNSQNSTSVSYVDDKFTSSKSKDNDYDSDTSSSCRKCDALFPDVRKRRQHCLETHGLEISFEGEKILFSEWKAGSLKQVPLESTSNTLADLILDNKEKNYSIQNKSCKLCSSKYLSFSALQKHMTSKHRIKAIRKMHLIRWTKRGKISPGLQRKASLSSNSNSSPNMKEAKELKTGNADIQTDCTMLSSPDKQIPAMTKCVSDTQPAQLREPLLYHVFSEAPVKTIKPGEHFIEISGEKQVQGSFQEREGTSKEIEQWKADFQRKRFFCYICDSYFSGYFILRRHMKVYHKIYLDQHGARITDTRKKYIDAKRLEKPVGSPNDDGVNGKIEKTLACDPIKDSSSIKDVSCKNNSLAANNTTKFKGLCANICFKKNSKGRYICPYCPIDFENLIDRHIHISDIHKKLKSNSVQPVPPVKSSTTHEKDSPTAKVFQIVEVSVPSASKSDVKGVNEIVNDSTKILDGTTRKRYRNPRGSGRFECHVCELKYVYSRGLHRHLKYAHNVHTTKAPSAAIEQSQGKSTNTDTNECSAKVIASLQAISVNDSHTEKKAAKGQTRTQDMDGTKSSRCFSPVPPCEEADAHTDILEGNIFWKLDSALKINDCGPNGNSREGLTYLVNEKDLSDLDSGDGAFLRDETARVELGSSKIDTVEIMDDEDVLDIVTVDPETPVQFESEEPGRNEDSGNNSTVSNLKCAICSVGLPNSEAMLQHRLDTGHKTGIVCTIPGCGKLLSCKRSYMQHLKNTCKLCHKRLSSEGNIRRHLRNIHKISDVLTCDICKEEFPEPISLALHNKEKHMN